MNITQFLLAKASAFINEAQPNNRLHWTALRATAESEH